MKTILWIACLVLGGCVADVADECSGNGDCPAARPACMDGVCVGAGGDVALPDALIAADAAPVDAAPADALPADARAPDAALHDAAPADAAVRDAAPDAAPAGDASCSAPGFPVFDDCNGQDDDCDGQTDEGDGSGPPVRGCYDGPPGTVGLGPCLPGVQTCSGGAWGECRGEVAPVAETCNGVDDDCNGQVDDSPDPGGLVEDCYEGPAGTRDVGVCAGGKRPCVGGHPGPCEGEVLPGQEICDGRDNDCNGQVDDAAMTCECQPGTTGACYSGPDGTAGFGPCHAGTSTCLPDGSGSGPCEGEVTPTVETCNGVDDDCNGTPDDVRGLGDPCQVGIGACQRPGTQVCAEGALRCDAQPGAPGAEVCDGVDNDCDGRVDQTAAGQPLTRTCYDGQPPQTQHTAPCHAGTQTCRNGVWSACLGEVVPGVEDCDGFDNDCNGEIDDVQNLCGCNPGEHRDCYTAAPGTVGHGPCHAGHQTCGPERNWGPCQEQVTPQAETCNGIDDDCDAVVDDVPGTGEACTVGQGACQSAGTTQCSGPYVVCHAPPGPSARNELCNGVDDDCDGHVDEDAAGAGSLCDDFDCLTTGTNVCVGGVLRCECLL